jgi:hypothetical protein
MPKRKPPAEKKTWARYLRDGWHLTLATGEELLPSRDLDATEAGQFSRTMPVYRIGFAMPVVELTGQRPEIAKELAKVAEGHEYDTNAVSLFEGAGGIHAVVFEYHH